MATKRKQVRDSSPASEEHRAAAEIEGNDGKDGRRAEELPGRDGGIAMPPKKAKQPKAAEVAVLRAWIAAGAKDDSSTVTVQLPEIKPHVHAAPPMCTASAGNVMVSRNASGCPARKSMILASFSALNTEQVT